MKKTAGPGAAHPVLDLRGDEFAPEVLKSIRDPFAVIDRDYRILNANKAMAYIHQSDRDDFIGRICYEVFWQRTAPCPDCILGEVFVSGRTRVKEMWMDFPDGGRRWGEVKAYPIRDESKEIMAVMVMVMEVTARKKDLQKQKAYSALLSKKLDEKTLKGLNVHRDDEVSIRVTFTKREIEVLRLLAEGYSNVQISEILAISPNTIKSHVNHAKVGFRTRLDLFMEHPLLRSSFLDIEDRESKRVITDRLQGSAFFKKVILVLSWFRHRS